MTVSELFSKLNLCGGCGNEITFNDLDDLTGGINEINVQLKYRGWDLVPSDYKEYAEREVHSIHVIGKKILISITK